MADFNDVLLCQITSKPYGSSKAISLAKSDFTQGSIVVDSYIRPDKIVTLDSRRLKKTLGTIASIKLDQVKQRLKSILEIS
jgi:mRNA interferase MazF